MNRISVDEYRKITKKKAKYGNEKVFYKGMIFDSKREADYAKKLDCLKHARELKERVITIGYQVPYKIIVNNKVVATYFADFRVTYGDLHQEVIDVKGVRTPLYILKKKLVEALYDIKIIEV